MVEPVRHRQTKGAATDMSEPKATASHLDSTRYALKSGHSLRQPFRAAGNGSTAFHPTGCYHRN